MLLVYNPGTCAVEAGQPEVKGYPLTRVLGQSRKYEILSRVRTCVWSQELNLGPLPLTHIPRIPSAFYFKVGFHKIAQTDLDLKFSFLGLSSSWDYRPLSSAQFRKRGSVFLVFWFVRLCKISLDSDEFPNRSWISSVSL